jgi:hypothetical protein
MAKRTYKNSRFAGEMLVAAELARLGYEVALGNVGTHNTRAFDLMAGDPVTGRTVGVSVKSLKSRNAFLIDPEAVRPDMVYVFVITGPAGTQPTFYVLNGGTLLADEARYFGKWGRTYRKTGRGITPGRGLEEFQDNWKALDG